MKQVRACRVGAFVAASLMGVSAPVRVLAVFARHVYLVVSLREENRVVILCPLSEQDGPLCIMLDHWPVWSELAGQEGFFHNGHIRIGPYDIQVGDTAVWPSAVATLSDSAVCLQQKLTETARLLVHGSDLLSSVLGACDPSALPSYALSQLAAGIRRGDASLLRKGAAELAGLGIGLSPAGDDFLCGLMLAAWFFLPDPVRVCAPLLEGARGTTTTLSFAFLDAASKGHASSVWCACFRELKNTQTNTVLQEHMTRIVAYGATSGADSLAGFIWGAALMESFCQQ